MRWDDIVGWGALVIVVAGILGVAYTTGVTPADLGAAVTGPGASSASAATASDPGGSGRTGESRQRPTESGESGDLKLDIRGMSKCGTTCRDVTVTLSNAGAAPVHDVAVTATIYTGGDAIWEGTERVGTIDARESYTATKRVQIGYADGIKIERNGGEVTLEAVVTSDQGTQVIRERKTVA